MPDGLFILYAPVPLFFAPAHYVPRSQIIEDLRYQIHYFASVHHLIQQAAFCTRVGYVPEQISARYIHRNALFTHRNFLIFIDYAVIVLVVATQVHISPDSYDIIPEKDGCLKPRNEKIKGRCYQVRVQIRDTRKSFSECFLKPAYVRKNLLFPSIGLLEAV